MTRTRAIRSTLTALALVLVAGVALANGPVTIAVNGMTYKDASDSTKAVTKVGVDLTCDGGLALRMTDKDKGNLGNVTVPGFHIDALTKDALKRVVEAEAIRHIGVFSPYPDGVAFRVDSTRHLSVLATAARHLAASGCQVSAPQPGANAFAFDWGGESLRAVFNSDAGGTTVYVGR